MKKFLSLAITLMMVLSIASIPAMAATLPAGAYEAGIKSSLTEYTYEAFTADFEAADYTAFEDFEDVPAGCTPVDAYLNNENGKDTIYPYEMAVSGVANGSFSLKLNNTNTEAPNLLFAFTEGNANIGNLSSGSYAVLAGYNKSDDSADISIVGGDGGVYNVMKVDGTAKADYKISAIGFALKYGSARKAMELVVTYDDETTATITTNQPASSTRNKSHFCGVKADGGKYITGLTIKTPDNNASFIIDDLGIIFEKPVAAGTVTIEGIEDTVAEPQYNAAKQIQLTATVTDADGVAINEPVEWSVDTSSGGGARTTIDANGLLTIKRYRDASIAGTLKVTATCGNASATKEIAVTEAPAYYAAAGNYNATDYTKAEFLADLAVAGRKAVANFELDSHSVSIYNPLTTDIKTTGSAVQAANGETITVKWSSYKDGNLENSRIADGAANGYANAIRLESSDPSANRYHELTVNTGALGDNKLTAVGMVIGNNAVDLNATFSIYLNGSDTPVKYTGLGSVAQTGVEAGPGFYGYKAPAGRYIEKIRFNANKASYLDDLGFIFEVPGEAPAISFSTDAAAGKIISSLADVTGDVYVNIAASAFADKKVLLALYGAGDELLDVAIANAGATQALAKVPAGKTLTGIKAFVWDIASLNPAQAPVEINN